MKKLLVSSYTLLALLSISLSANAESFSYFSGTYECEFLTFSSDAGDVMLNAVVNVKKNGKISMSYSGENSTHDSDGAIVEIPVSGTGSGKLTKYKYSKPIYQHSSQAKIKSADSLFNINVKATAIITKFTKNKLLKIQPQYNGASMASPGYTYCLIKPTF